MPRVPQKRNGTDAEHTCWSRLPAFSSASPPPPSSTLYCSCRFPVDCVGNSPEPAAEMWVNVARARQFSRIPPKLGQVHFPRDHRQRNWGETADPGRGRGARKWDTRVRIWEKGGRESKRKGVMKNISCGNDERCTKISPMLPLFVCSENRAIKCVTVGAIAPEAYRLIILSLSENGRRVSLVIAAREWKGSEKL